MKKKYLALIIGMFLLVSITAGAITKTINLDNKEKKALEEKIDLSNIKVGECMVMDKTYCLSKVTYEDNKQKAIDVKEKKLQDTYIKELFDIKINYLKCGSFNEFNDCTLIVDKTAEEIEIEVLSIVEKRLKDMSVDKEEFIGSKSNEILVDIGIKK